MLKRLLILITVVSMLAAFSFSVVQAGAPVVSDQSTPAQVEFNPSNLVSTQIIMKDGNICSPRLGCW